MYIKNIVYGTIFNTQYLSKIKNIHKYRMITIRITHLMYAITFQIPSSLKKFENCVCDPYISDSFLYQGNYQVF